MATLALRATVVAGDDAPRPIFEERVEVAEIVLDAVVVDRDGNPVPGLDVEDLVVLEDRRPIELTSVRFYSSAHDDEAARLDLPSSRYFIVFVHDARFQQAQPLSALPAMLRQQRDAGLAMRDWFLDGLGPSDWVAVVGFGRGGLRVVQDFTQDRDALAAAAEDASMGGLAKVPARQRRKATRGSTSGVPTTPRGLSLARALATGIARERVETPRRPRRPRGAVDEALRRVASAASTIVGRKDLVLISPGLGVPYRRKGTPDPFPALAETLATSNVVLSVIDLGGPRPRGSEAAVAHGSGGQFLTGGPIRHHLDRLARETRGYYVLSYQTSIPAGARGWRRLEVYARDRDLTVRTRGGYRLGAP